MPRPRPARQGRLRRHGARGPPLPEKAFSTAEMDQPGHAGERHGAEHRHGGGEREEVPANDGAAVWGEGAGWGKHVEFGGFGEA